MREIARWLDHVSRPQPRITIVDQANAAQGRGDWAEAATLYENAIAKFPTRADLMIQLGHANKERGQYRLSYESYLRAIEVQPDNDDAYLHLGHLLKVTGNILCASRCYRAAAQWGNSNAQLEYDAIALITNPPIFQFRNNALSENRSIAVYSDDELRRLRTIVGALEMCEVVASDTGRLEHAAQLLFHAGFQVAARGMFEMCFIRAGFGPSARRNSIETALRTGLWGQGGPLAPRVNDGVFRSGAPAARRAIIGWLVNELHEDPPEHQDVAPTLDSVNPFVVPMQEADPRDTLGGPCAAAPHHVLSQHQAPEINGLVARLYSTLARSDATSGWAELGDVLRDVQATVAEAVPLISFDSDDMRQDVEIHASRVLFNNLFAFVAENSWLITGPPAVAGILAKTSRFEHPLTPYLGEPSAFFASPAEIVDDIAEEIARIAYKHELRDALERVIGILAPRLHGSALLRLFGMVVDARLQGAGSAILKWAVASEVNNPNFLVQISQMLKNSGHFSAALGVLRRIPRTKSPLLPTSIEFAILVELGIVEKICGNFINASDIFTECLTYDSTNEFVVEELLTVLPEVEDINRIVEKIDTIGPGARELAQRRQLYRLHLEGWDLHVPQTQLDAQTGDDLTPEIAFELVEAPGAGAEREDLPECVDIVQLGWERHHSRWGELAVLRGVEAIRVRVVSAAPLVAMRVRFDGRTVCREEVRVQDNRSSATHEYVFNAWVNTAMLRPGLHNLQLDFEERGGGYRIREELVFVARRRDDDRRQRNSGSVVTLDKATAGLPLCERINAMPSIVYPARRQFFDVPIERILVVRADQLGDFVISMPAIERLRELFPDARLFGLVSPTAVELARSLDIFEGLFEVRMSYVPREARRYLALSEQIRLRQQLRELSFDLAIDLSSGDDTRPLLRLSGAPVKVGFKPHQFPWLSFGIDAVTRDLVNRREAVSHGTLMMMLVDGLQTMLRPRSLSAGVVARRADRRLLEKFGIGETEPFLLLHSGARLRMKRWPLMHYCELARLAFDATDLKVVLVVDDAGQLPQIEDAGLPADRLRVITGPLPFAELDALVSHCEVMVGNDSGPKHLAASRGARVVSVHMGQVNWQEWGQEGDGLIVTHHVPCYGCGIVEAHQCGKDLACLIHIRPADVFAAVRSLLTKNAR